MLKYTFDNTMMGENLHYENSLGQKMKKCSYVTFNREGHKSINQPPTLKRSLT